MQCPKCHAQNQDDAAFCSLCLASFDDEASKTRSRMPRLKRSNRLLPGRINKLAFLVLAIMLVYGFFAKDNYRQVNDIHPALYQEPKQVQTSNPITKRFERDGYDYQLTPLYDYEINALIVSRKDYRRFSLKRINNLFPLDLCVLWGGNVEKKLYQSNKLFFRQDSRQSNWTWFGNLGFNNFEAANIHLIAENDSIQNRLDKLQIGDQIKIIGQLVDVKAKALGETDVYEPTDVQLHSSTTRTDSGPGACEIIDVKDIEVLKKANFPANLLFRFSYFSLALLLIGNMVVFVAKIMSKTERLKTDRQPPTIDRLP